VTDFSGGPLFELIERPDVERPVFVVHLEGWIDAGAAAVTAVGAALTEQGSKVVARFDTEQLLDHRARRPVMHINDGVNTGLTWPEIMLELATDRTGTPFLVLHGPEPDHNWRRFTDAVLHLAVEFDTRIVVGFGAYPAASPHTRPPRLSATATDRALAAQVGFVNATLDIPAGVQAAIERKCVEFEARTAPQVMDMAALTWADLVCGRTHDGRVNQGHFAALRDHLEALGKLPKGGVT